MTTIFEAKKLLAAHYWSEEGFVGVGIGLHKNSDVLQVYVEGQIALSRGNLHAWQLMRGFL